jgi:uncharacterized protein
MPPTKLPSSSWRDKLRLKLPTREDLAAQPWLKPIAHHLFDRKLWAPQHEAVARGVAVGMFWAFALPFAQIVAAAAHCVWWRANIPVAAAITFITNPFTVGFWLYLAYKLGNFFIDAPAPLALGQATGLEQWLRTIGWPALLGMALFATGGSVLGYALVKISWRVRVAFKRRQRGR